jgi:D-alanyl-D-alanine carboxypeptidase
MTQFWRFGGEIGDTTTAARVIYLALSNGEKPVDILATQKQVQMQVSTTKSAREDNMGIGAVDIRSRSAVQAAERCGLAKTALLTSLTVGLALAASQAEASVRAAIVLDQNTGRIYKSYNANVYHKPASLTKMMSLYLVFDALKAGRLRLNQRVRVSYRAASRPPSKMYLRAGQRITIRKLIYGMAVKSANDAATAAAEAVAGSEAAFARMMTMKARELGMYRTVFRTASGLPARGQITTAKDMAVLARALRRDHPRYYKVFSARYFRHAGH